MRHTPKRSLTKYQLSHIHAVLYLARGLTKKAMRITFCKHVITMCPSGTVYIDQMRFESLDALHLESKK